MNLGPISRIEQVDPDAICVISTEKPEELNEHDLQDIFNSINRKIQKQSKSNLLNLKNSSHNLLLLLDLISINIIEKDLIIHDQLKKFGNTDISLEEVRRHATLLDFLGLIHLRCRGNEKFLVRHKDTPSLVSYTGTKENPFDRIKFKFARQNLVNQNQRLKSVLEEPK